MAAPVFGIVSAGAMGSAVGERLTAAGCSVWTNLKGRSQATRDRAREAGMVDGSYEEIAKKSSIFLSILPPSDAEDLAKQFSEAVKSKEIVRDNPIIFADCNAVNPETVTRIADFFAEHNSSTSSDKQIKFLDASIIGGPPQGDYNPAIYVSAHTADEAALNSFVDLGNYGLKIKPLTGAGAGIGDASALKMSYAGMTKGLTGLFATMILSASASSPATAEHLLSELQDSQPFFLKRINAAVPSALPKAYRWGGEMREIGGFVDSMASKTGREEPIGDIYRGLGQLYDRIATDKAAVKILGDFAKQARDKQS